VGVVPIPIYVCAELFQPNRLRDVEDCDRLLVIGTTLATYSAFRLVKHAVELNKPVFVLNMGPTRADGLPEIQKVDGLSGSVLSEVVRTIL
jgi:NAD-dependent deacetylase sirtuin 4